MIGYRKWSLAVGVALIASLMLGIGKIEGGNFTAIVTSTVTGFFAANLFGDHRSKNDEESE